MRRGFVDEDVERARFEPSALQYWIGAYQQQGLSDRVDNPTLTNWVACNIPAATSATAPSRRPKSQTEVAGLRRQER
jgi:hypothetical protein